VGAMTLSYDTARCTGNWLGVHGEFGRTLNQQCIGCARRTQTEHGERQSWMTVEVLVGECKYRIGDQT